MAALMPRLYLIRHGKASADWSGHSDPPLAPEGHQQAQAMARRMAPLGPLPLLSSPLARTRETADPLARAWSTTPAMEPRVGEIPSPDGMALTKRLEWLKKIAGQHWPELEPPLQQWRRTLLETLGSIQTDTVIVSHFIAINTATGAAIGDDRVVHFAPGYCSITTLKVTPDGLQLIERGTEAKTKIL